MATWTSRHRARASPGWRDTNVRTYCDDANETSSAAAIASGAAALIWSAHPDWTVNQVTRALFDTAGRGWPKNKPRKYLGYGAVRPRVVLANPHYSPRSRGRRSACDGERRRSAGQVRDVLHVFLPLVPVRSFLFRINPVTSLRKGFYRRYFGGRIKRGVIERQDHPQGRTWHRGRRRRDRWWGRGRRAGAARQVTSFEWTCRGQYRGVEV
ncbi:S8 family serine peptidase [Streptomyces sp. NRRL WC-3725]|uniref:S8 family serine peptidase n=1 Tax=Streptomyces sp. NRRL WC-3725 TaxID=1463933 RepID=UPI001F1BDB44|nr:S8 family serine peptidase [Streptomyces sp. NRRL WC-3725]